ncbi:BglG family transcription antiterminator [Alkalicoccobacillus porphyridii]|uniref:BglG family transcription antiterminator n=1 Tax=Alkalicoccobacillus porphyridii TaxID=2597270 RepID=A0A554A124_9BACI|nr:PRD domain-containing protein [Alkalicoccobacillus porphyridii]TSB47398.1 BglG family transcription antiterminator [Alkalicoccobacillus porphyridii]
MQEKRKQLIDFLSKQNQGFVSAATLADMLNVTDRTIRNYIKDINENFSDIVIISSPQGYAIVTDDSLGNQEEVDLTNKEPEEAILEFEIIQYLMNRDDYTTYEELAETFFYSPQTIRSRMQRLTMNIHSLGIDVSINTRVFKGIKLNGTEIQKRTLLESFFTSIPVKKENFKDFVFDHFRSWVNAETIENVFKRMDELNIEYQLNIEFTVYKKLAVQLLIMIHQMNQKRFVVIENNELHNLKSFKEFEVAQAFRTQLKDYVSFTEDEVVFLVNYLMSLQLDLEKEDVTNHNSDIVKRIEDILRKVEQVYHVPTYSKNRFRHNILNHIYRIINPASHNLLIYNPFVKETKAEYFFSFSVASNLALQIEKEFHVEIQDSEIAYLAYHIQVIIQSKDKKKRKTILLYTRGYERTELLASKITTYFDELDIVGIEKYSTGYEFADFYLYIGVDLTEAAQNNANVVSIQSSFKSADIKRIRFFLEAQNMVIERADIYWINETSPEKAIRHLLEISELDTFYDPIMKRETMSYTSIGNLVAIPHPYFERKEYKERVVIGVNDHVIQWGTEKVQLVIIYIPSSDVERNEYVFTEFFQKTKSIERVRSLVHTTNEEEFLAIWNQI